MNLILSPAAECSLAYILRNDESVGIKLFNQLKYKLPYEPLPNDRTPKKFFYANLINELKKENYEIFRLKSGEFRGYRVFYLIDDKNDVIYILEIFKRSESTYDKNHMEKLKKLYILYYTNR